MVFNTSKVQSFNDLLKEIENESIENLDNYDEDLSPSPVKDVDEHIILREYIRNGDNFHADEKFYKLDMDSLSLINLNDCDDTMYYSKENNSYFSIESCVDSNIEFENKKYMDIYIFKDMFLDVDELKISKQDLIIRLSLNNIELDPKFIKDLYLDIYHKIHIKDSPFKYNQTMNKRYLFPVNVHHSGLPTIQKDERMVIYSSSFNSSINNDNCVF